MGSYTIGSITPSNAPPFGTYEEFTLNWDSVKEAYRPPTVDATDWNNVWNDFVALVGTTVSSYGLALSQEAEELSKVGDPTSDPTTLTEAMLLQASGAMAGTYLSVATDIAPTSSELSLSLDRYYNGTLLERDATMAFGDGWTFTYDVSVVTDSSGNVYVQAPGVLHVFTLQSNGSYQAGAGDNATLTASDGLYTMEMAVETLIDSMRMANLQALRMPMAT